MASDGKVTTSASASSPIAGGFALKQDLTARLDATGHDVVDFSTGALDPDDDCPDFVASLTRAVAAGRVSSNSHCARGAMVFARRPDVGAEIGDPVTGTEAIRIVLDGTGIGFEADVGWGLHRGKHWLQGGSRMPTARATAIDALSETW